MTQAPVQLPLNISLQAQACLENFQRADKGVLHQALRQWLDNAGPALILLRGVAGTGKTHLLNACAAKLRQRQLSYAWFDLETLVHYPADLLLQQSAPWLLLDNVQAIAALPDWQTTLYELINRAQAGQLRLLLSLDGALSDMLLADLQSRLAWGLVFQLQALSEAEIRQVVQQRASSLGLELPDNSLDYLWLRYSRDLCRLLDLLQQLDRYALQRQRMLTRPLLRDFLASQAAASMGLKD